MVDGYVICGIIVGTLTFSSKLGTLNEVQSEAYTPLPMHANMYVPSMLLVLNINELEYKCSKMHITIDENLAAITGNFLSCTIQHKQNHNPPQTKKNVMTQTA
jgi:hypothetical protein